MSVQLLGLLCVAAAATQSSLAHSSAPVLCDPAGVWFSAGDHTKHQPLTVVQNTAAKAECPETPKVHQSFLASAKGAWQNDNLCLYQNGSLWYTQVPTSDSGSFGAVKTAAHCDSLRWRNGAKWCRSTSTTCLGPPPPPPPPPSPWPVYSVPHTGVSFTCSDATSELAAMFTKGETAAKSNVKPFRQQADGNPVDVMVEGEEYGSAWIETQPMAGAMYAQRDVRVALNNQLIFMRSARSDGIMAHRVDANPAGQSVKPVYFNGGPGIQGLYLAYPAVDVAFFLNLTSDGSTVTNPTESYLRELEVALINYDRWMWTHRNDSTCCSLHGAPGPEPTGAWKLNASCCPPTPSPGSGEFLWSTGDTDTGEDGTDKYSSNKVPIQSMDMLGYSISTRRSLARIASLLGDAAAEAEWTAKAAVVTRTLATTLWRSEEKACFDKDVNGAWVTTLVHNNLRMMWHQAFSQTMADDFVAAHLMNSSEFFTKMPLPSIAVSDKRFKDKKGNNWSGPIEGLTVQRTIRALENYGHHAESVLVGLALTAALLPRDGALAASGKASAQPVGGNFPQQIEPFTGVPEPGDGYGPMIMSFLEYTALRMGIIPRPARSALLWSALLTPGVPGGGGSGATHTYTQRLGADNYTLVIDPSGAFVGSKNGERLFSAWGGLRVLTDLSGAVTEVWGIANTTRAVGVSLPSGGPTFNLTLKPNEEWSVDMTQHPPTSKLLRAAPFVAPF